MSGVDGFLFWLPKNRLWSNVFSRPDALPVAKEFYLDEKPNTRYSLASCQDKELLQPDAHPRRHAVI